MDVGKQMNPVLILTGRELFSEFMMTDSYSIYGDKAEYARSTYMRDDIQELCDFTQHYISECPHTTSGFKKRAGNEAVTCPPSLVQG